MEKEFASEQYQEKPSMDRSEIIENQLKQVDKIELEIDKDKLNVEYQILDVRDENEIKEAQEKNDKTVVVIQGFPSRIGTQSELNKSLALKGKRVITLSLPGLGNSDNPPESWLKGHLFEKQSEVINQLLENIAKQEQEKNIEITTKNFDIIGISMGAMIGTKFLKHHPKKVANLVFITPVGIQRKSAVELAARSPYSAHEEQKDVIIERFKDDPEKTKRAFEKMKKAGEAGSSEWTKSGKKSQRLLEIKLMAQGGLTQDLKDYEGNVLLMTGSRDRISRPDQLKKIEKEDNKAKVITKIIPGASHGGPIYDAEEYAEEIAKCLNKWHEEELKEK